MNRYILELLILSSEGFHNSLAIIIFLPLLMIIAAATGERWNNGMKGREKKDIFRPRAPSNSYNTNFKLFQKK